MKRLVAALAPVVALLMFSASALAEDQPFKTVVDTIVPKTPGLTIEGSTGGCDLLLQKMLENDPCLSRAANHPDKAETFMNPIS